MHTRVTWNIWVKTHIFICLVMMMEVPTICTNCVVNEWMWQSFALKFKTGLICQSSKYAHYSKLQFPDFIYECTYIYLHVYTHTYIYPWLYRYTYSATTIRVTYSQSGGISKCEPEIFLTKFQLDMGFLIGGKI